MVTLVGRRSPEITRLSGTIGAVADGIDLRQPLDDDDAERIRRALADHYVVFFRGQALTDAEQCALAAEFGELAVSPIHKLIGSERRFPIIEDSQERPPAGFDWHTDLSWTSPPALGFLNALAIPRFGGDTLWASLPAAYDTLSPRMRTMCQDVQVLHHFDSSLLASVERHNGQEAARRLVAEHPAVEHPLVTVHPASGRPCLFLPPLYVEGIVGLRPDESSRFLAELRRTIEDPHVQVRWRWERGDVAIWDEASICHRALTDHFPQPRRMRRCVVAAY